MGYLEDLPRTTFGPVDCLAKEKPEETIVYIHVGGQISSELEQALQCLYFDNSRKFKLVDIKRQQNLISALVVMEREPVKF